MFTCHEFIYKIGTTDVLFLFETKPVGSLKKNRENVHAYYGAMTCGANISQTET